MEPKADIALIGLAVMGQNLILNMNDHGFIVVAYNRTVEKVDQFLANEAKGTKVLGAHSIPEMVAQLKRPRRVMMLVKAGKPVDDFIEQLLPHLEPGDIIIDGGNSLFEDTIRRAKYVENKGLLYIGTGVSGGEEGARHGPSIMPGGSPAAWPHVKTIFQAVAAKMEDGTPCCDWVGEGGAGHYVKMVHNGIEYGLMQLIAETYDLMKRGLGLSDDELRECYAEWNHGELEGYLLEITSKIFATKDGKTGPRLIDEIRAVARQLGTGMWTSQSAMELQVPVPTIDAAVAMRNMSALESERTAASAALRRPTVPFPGDRGAFLAQLAHALFVGTTITYAQGLALLAAASKRYAYDLDLSVVAGIWRGGCIIRAAVLEDICGAYTSQPRLPNLLLDPKLAAKIMPHQEDLRAIVGAAAQLGLPAPAFMTSLSYMDSYRSSWLPANLIQAQRDYFGSHAYERVDAKGTFHTEWESPRAL